MQTQPKKQEREKLEAIKKLKEKQVKTQQTVKK